MKVHPAYIKAGFSLQACKTLLSMVIRIYCGCMATDQEILSQIMAKLKEKVGDHASVCAICGHNEWEIGPHYLSLPLTKDPTQVALGGQAFPLIALVCGNCGNTYFVNLKVLGFSNLQPLRLSEGG